MCSSRLDKQSDLVAYEENIIVQQPLNTTFKMSLLCAIQTDHIAKRRQNDIGLKDWHFPPNICICWMIIQVFKLQFSSTIYSLRMLIQNERKNKNFRKRIKKKKKQYKDMWRMILASFILYFYFIKVRLRFKRS